MNPPGERHAVFPYSPERRTALVLCGTGAHGVYHAGVLRALQEAGVKIDVMAGQGIGAAGAALAAIDGAARLWDADGIWRRPGVSNLYRWKAPLRAGMWCIPLLLAASLVPVFVPVGAGPAVLRWLPLLALAAVVLALFGGEILRSRERPRRRAGGAWWWRLLGAPLDADGARKRFARVIGELIPGTAPRAASAASALGRRYAEILADGLGQPGFRELMIVATDLDSRRDVVGVLLREPYRRELITTPAAGERRADVLDLAGDGRDVALDLVAAALTPPMVCDPHLLTFATDGYWRGETHRLCDRPGAVSRLLQELAAAGVSQAIIASAVPVPAEPHRLTVPRLAPPHRLGEFLAASECAALRDAMEMARLRFDSVYLICPAHNPVGPFDLAGAYDEASDRRQDLQELMDRGYEDAYRRFIEPVVGGSGEHLASTVASEGPQSHRDAERMDSL